MMQSETRYFNGILLREFEVTVLQVFSILVLLFKSLSPLQVAISYFLLFV